MSSLPVSGKSLTGLREGTPQGRQLSVLLETPLAQPAKEKHMRLPEVTK